MVRKVSVTGCSKKKRTRTRRSGIRKRHVGYEFKRILAQASRPAKGLIRLASLSVEMGGFHNEVLSSVRRTLFRKYGSLFRIDTFYQNSSHPEVLDAQAKEIINREYDGIISIGLKPSHSALRVVSGLKCSMPIFISGVTDPVKDDLMRSYACSRNNVTGVATKTPSHIVPVDLTSDLFPHASKYCIVYRKSLIDDSSRVLFADLKERFDKEGKALQLYEVDTPKLNSNIFTVLDQQEIVLLPEGLVFYADRDVIVERYKDSNDVFVFADGKEAVDRGAIFGICSDLNITGAALASRIEKVFIEGLKPSKVKALTIRFARRLAFNHRRLAQFGVYLSPDMCHLYDLRMAHNRPLTREERAEQQGLLSWSRSAGDKYLIRRIINKLANEIIEQGGIPPSRHLYEDIVPENHPPQRQSVRAAVEELFATTHAHQLHIGGGHAVEEAVRQNNKREEKFSLYTMLYGYDIGDGIGINKDLDAGQTHLATIVSPLDPGRVFHAVKESMARVQKICIPIGLNKTDMPRYWKKYLAKEKDACESLKLSVEHMSSKESADLESWIEKRSFKSNAVVLMQQLLSDDMLKRLVEVCARNGVVHCVVGDGYVGRVPIAIELQQEAFENDASFVQHKEHVWVRMIGDDAYVVHRSRLLLELCKGGMAKEKPYDITMHDVI